MFKNMFGYTDKLAENKMRLTSDMHIIIGMFPLNIKKLFRKYLRMYFFVYVYQSHGLSFKISLRFFQFAQNIAAL